MGALVGDVVHTFDLFMVGYWAVLLVVNTALAVAGWRAIEDYVRRRPMRDYTWVGQSPLTLPVSILAPAYNEGPVIVPAIRALMAAQFVNFEVIVVNEGRTTTRSRFWARASPSCRRSGCPGPTCRRSPFGGCTSALTIRAWW